MGVLLNRARETNSASGTTDFTVTGAVTGHQTIEQAGVSDGDVVSYMAENTAGTEWELGTGAYATGTNVLQRTTIIDSSNSGAKVNFTAAPQVSIAVLAEDIVRPSADFTADNRLVRTDGASDRVVQESAATLDDSGNLSGIGNITLSGTVDGRDVAADGTKLDFITVTQAVDLDQMETDIAALANGMVYAGDWDASAGTFPGGGTAQTGAFYYVSVAGTVDSVSFAVGDNIVATTDNASTSTYASNWSKHDQTDAVQAVLGLTGSISKASLLGAIGGAIEDLDALGANTGDNEVLISTGAGVLAWESGATLLTSIGLGTGNSPQFTAIELGHATDTSITRVSAGRIAVEGSNVLMASDKATEANLRQGTADVYPDAAIIEDFNEFAAVTFAASYTHDFHATSWFITTTQTANMTFNNPSNMETGMIFVAVVTMDGTGGYTISFGTDWEFEFGTVDDYDDSANAVNVIIGLKLATGQILTQIIRGIG